MAPALLVPVLAVVSKILLVGTLALLHLSRQRLRSVPAPLFRRSEPVRGRTRLSEAAFGLGACYTTCVVVFFFALFGQPHGASLTLTPIDGSPAQQAGIAPGDRARSVGGTPVKTFDDFRSAVAKGPETVTVEVEREGRLVSLGITKDQNNLIGVMPGPGEPRGALSALSEAVATPAKLWLTTIMRPLRGEPVKIAGPVAIVETASGGGPRLIYALALGMTLDLLLIGLAYIVVLATDARSRARYQALRTSSALS